MTVDEKLDTSGQSSSRQSSDIATMDGQTATGVAPASAVVADETHAADSNSSAEEAAPERKIRGVKWLIVVVAILSSTFLFSLDNTVVADVQPTIIRQFGSVDKLSWLSVGYLLGSTTTNLLWGQIYSQFDGKWVYIFSVLLFELGSVVCGAAPTMNALIVGRVICGLGGAGLYTGVMVLFSVHTTPKERPTYFGLTGISWGAGTCLGPIIGGAFSDSSATWRWAFYINLVVGGICAPAYLFLIPRADPQTGKKFSSRVKEIDWLGALLICGMFLSGLMAISFGGTVYAWSSGQIIGLFVVFGVLLIILFAQQILEIGTTKERRLFPVEFLKNTFIINMFLQTAAGTTSVFIPIYFIPLYFAFVHGDSALASGVRLLPYVIPMSFVCVVNGYAMSYFGYYMPWYMFGGALCLTGSALLHSIDVATNYSRIYGYSAIIGVGAGAYIQASFSVAQVKAPPHLQNHVVGLLTMAQLGGPAFSLSIANAAFLNDALKALTDLLPELPRTTVLQVISGARTDAFRQLSSDIKPVVVNIIVQSLRKAFIVPLVAGALTLLLACTMKWEKLFVAEQPDERVEARNDLEANGGKSE